MALRVYLDDCAYSHPLADPLRQAVHEVVVLVDVGLRGEDDPVHFACAVERGLVLLTKNPADFLALHESNRDHPGVLAVYQDNDVSRDMTDAEIVQAIQALEQVYVQTGAALAGQFHVLNQWRIAGPALSPPAQPGPKKGKGKK